MCYARLEMILPNNFVVFCFARTGSYHLTSMLDSCPDIVCHGEIFKTKSMELRKWHAEQVTAKTVAERDDGAEVFVRELRELNPARHFGFKVFPSHLYHVPYLRKVMNSREWRVVALWRDPISVFASLERATQTKIWTLKAGANPAPTDVERPIHFSPEKFEKFYATYSAFTKRCQNISKKKNGFLIKYDQLEDQETWKNLLSFIGSNSSADELKSDYRKQFTKPLEEGFTNPDEFREYIKTTDLIRL